MITLSFLTSRYGAFPAQYYSGQVRWEYWDLLYIHNGVVHIHIQDREITLNQGYALLIPPGIPFTVQNKGTMASASVQYFMPYIDSSLARRLKPYKEPLLTPALENLNIDSHINELMALYTGEKGVSRRQELLMELIIEKILLSRNKIAVDKTIWEKMIEKYRDSTYQIPSMEKLAEEAGYSPSRFRTLFRQHTGLSPARYFLNLRMEQSACLLKETTLPIKRIAYRCGYGEVSHFNRAFTKHYSQSPGRYRKRNQLKG